MRPGTWVWVVGVALIGACSSSPMGDSTTISSEPPSTTTSSVTTTTVEAVQVWVRAEIEPRAPDNGYESMNAVVVFQGHLIAVGTAGQQAAVWDSSDGLLWTRRPNPPGLADDGADLQDVIVGGPGLVAVGSARTEDGRLDAAVWTSTDGLGWSRVPHDPSVFGGSGAGAIRSIAEGPGGLVGVGFSPAYSEGLVVVSPDGLTWSRVPHDDDLFGYPSFRSIEEVVAFDGGFVAVGSVWSDEGPLAAAWVSPDGHTWSRTVAPTVGEMRALTVIDGALIAVGWQTSGAAVWVSEDGIEWTRIGGTSARPPGSEMRAVFSTGDGVVAVGYTPESGSSDGAVWRSADGRSWSRDQSPALGGRWSQGILAGVEFAGGIALVGTDSTELGGITPAGWFIGPQTAVVPTTTTIQAPQQTIVTPGAPDFQMRCDGIERAYESPPPTTYPNCGWRVITDPWWNLARWKLDPDNPPDPSGTVLHVLATETACAGGAVPEGREIRSALMTSGSEVVVFVLIEPSQYPMDCPGNPAFPMTIDLGRPLGELSVYEGFLVPPLERYPVP